MVNTIAPRVVPENPARKAVVAQLVEQLIRNQQVTGSSPVNGSIQFNNFPAFEPLFFAAATIDARSVDGLCQ